MSERSQQIDTSRIVKNPLLSGVTGLIDDFTHNSVLLPAAAFAPGIVERSDIINKGEYNIISLQFIYLFINIL